MGVLLLLDEAGEQVCSREQRGLTVSRAWGKTWSPHGLMTPHQRARSTAPGAEALQRSPVTPTAFP